MQRKKGLVTTWNIAKEDDEDAEPTTSRRRRTTYQGKEGRDQSSRRSVRRSPFVQ